MYAYYCISVFFGGGGELKLEVGNPRAPPFLYATLIIYSIHITIKSSPISLAKFLVMHDPFVHITVGTIVGRNLSNSPSFPRLNQVQSFHQRELVTCRVQIKYQLGVRTN